MDDKHKKTLQEMLDEIEPFKRDRMGYVLPMPSKWTLGKLPWILKGRWNDKDCKT